MNGFDITGLFEIFESSLTWNFLRPTLLRIQRLTISKKTWSSPQKWRIRLYTSWNSNRWSSTNLIYNYTAHQSQQHWTYNLFHIFFRYVFYTYPFDPPMEGWMNLYFIVFCKGVFGSSKWRQAIEGFSDSWGTKFSPFILIGSMGLVYLPTFTIKSIK